MYQPHPHFELLSFLAHSKNAFITSGRVIKSKICRPGAYRSVGWLRPVNNNVGNKEKEPYLFIYKDSSDKVISSLVIKIICKQLWNLRSNSKIDFFEQQIIIILFR